MEKTRNVAILIFDDVEVLDYAGPFEVFTVAGEVIPFQSMPHFFTYNVGVTGDMIVTRGQMRVTPHYSIANAPQPDILIVPGGYGARRLVMNPAVLDWLREQAQKVEILMSVCTGALVLARAGLLENKPATTHHESFGLLASISPSTTIIPDQRYVQSGSILTAGGISAGIDASLSLLDQLVGTDNAAHVRKEMEWMWHTSQPGV